MKKVLLFTLALCIAVSGYSQIATPPKALLNKSVKVEYKKPIRDLSNFTVGVNPTVKSVQFVPDETQVGTTWYDLYSNTLIGTNLFRFEDGTMSAAWTFGLEASTFPDRGTGYNYFDGNTWGPAPTERIETERCGWGHNYDWGTDGEAVISHSTANEQLMICLRETKGTGDWTEIPYTGADGADPTWPRHATSGDENQYLHVIYHSYVEYGGMPGALLYTRSMDGGASWDPQDVILDGTGPDFYYEIQADAYDIVAKGDVVAILVSGAWNDMFIMKSEDNGDTWDKIMVWEHPFPFFDFETHSSPDTVFSNDNSASIAIDADGKCHVTFGIMRILHDATGTTYSLFPFIDGIGYWNEDMEPFSNDISALAPPQYEYPTSEMIEDYNYIGYAQDVDGDGEITYITTSTGFPMYYRELGVSTMPDIHVDDMGRVFVVFASYTETYDNFEWNYHKIWARAYENGSWGPFYHVTEDIVHIFDESIYPTIASTSDDNIYFMYQADGTPGLALDDDHDYQENRMIVAALPKTDVLTGVKNPGTITEASVSQNYPNPFSNTTTITVNLKDNADLSLEVTNLTGQQIMLKERGYVNAGTYFFQVDASDLPTGIYFYTVTANESQVTRKMIVK